MNYRQLQNIYDKKIENKPTNIPVDSRQLISSLPIRLKNSLECKNDCGENYPLLHCNACLYTVNGEFTIYYDEKYPYYNFAIAHEIAHWLLKHSNEGIAQHREAQLLAAIIIAPIELLQQSNITSAVQLAEQCRIPIDIAEEYWSEIKDELNLSDKSNNQHLITLLLTVTIAVLSFVLGFTVAQLTATKSNNTTRQTTISTEISTDAFTTIETTSENKMSHLEDSSEQVYITKTGDKYHTADCQYIESHDTIPISIEQAHSLGYEPCKVCFK